MSRGKLITFEGIDQTGKSTQIELVSAWLKRRQLPVLITREPGGTYYGRVMRDILLSGKTSLDPKAELCLMMADRAQHIWEVIAPALQEGTIVLCDRFTDSSLAYQGYGLGEDLHLIEQLNKWTTGGLTADLTLLFDREVGSSFGDRRDAADRIEQRDLGYKNRVRQGYLNIHAQHPKRVMRIDVTGKSKEQILDEIKPMIEKLLKTSCSRLRKNGDALA
ncbi:MAG: dTMP kinase [Limnochordia bacterium]|nr:dTMP kinase [Limnochordia bacterium]